MKIINKTNDTIPKIRRLTDPNHQTPASCMPADLNVSCELKKMSDTSVE